ncbi:hypothetical protein FNF29_07286 [Cafeteria roenbergensis]|uniref:Anaphase-promoting complex subunit 2 C-terminal domain-containing protein n=1 Tax=Cafeteria roenbergensis TaxID=33653 RepID=A0A5A8C6M1_CAFRO|nr:hypothetical protein FNF29_07286 [Cafeteria roenbergensis]|eukprot:KAA0147541.1 hypothetical protein FNF29_07286 [Cafeteria roenbergensis]
MLVMRQAVKVATVTRMERALDCVARALSAIDAKQVPSAALRRGLSSGPAGSEDAHGGETGAVERGPTLGAAVAAAMDGLEALGECRLCLAPVLGDGPADAFAGAAARQAGSATASRLGRDHGGPWDRLCAGLACVLAAAARRGARAGASPRLRGDAQLLLVMAASGAADRAVAQRAAESDGAARRSPAALPGSEVDDSDESDAGADSADDEEEGGAAEAGPGAAEASVWLLALLRAAGLAAVTEAAAAAVGWAIGEACSAAAVALVEDEDSDDDEDDDEDASRDGGDGGHSLRCVDPSGVLLGAATAPVRAYLGRDRPDAVKRVVEMLMTPASAPRDAGAGGAGGGRVEDSAAEGGQDEDDDDEDDKEEDEEEEANPLRQELEAARSGPRASMPGPDDTDSEDEEEEVGPHGVVSSADTGAAGHRSDEPVLPWKPPSLVAEAWQHGASRGAPADRTASGRRRRRILASALLPTGELGGVAPAPPLALSDILADDASLGAVEEDSADLLWGIITVLGGPAPLVKAYDERLATALLSSGKAWDVEELVTTHELIKTRLGEREVLSAEVMLKDLSDSRRIAATIRSTRANPPARRGVAPAPAPVAPAEGAVHPAPAASLPGAVEAAALARAGARAGVDESDDESVAGTPLSPATASARRAERAVFDGSPLPLPRALVLSRLFWPGLAGYGGEAPTARPPPTVLHPRLRHGLGKYTSDFETAKAPRKLTWLSHLGSVCVDVALPGRDKPVEASGTLAQQELLVRQFAVGMLRSHGSMPLQRVLSMLRSFSPYSGSEADLRAAMNKLVAEGVLTRTGDAYELA